MNKKILAILMALLMVLTSVAALADGTINDLTNTTEETQITVTKTFTGEGKATETFNFDLKNADGTVVDTVAIEVAANAESNTGVLTIPTGLTGPDTYNFTITEQEGAALGVTYDTTTSYAVKVSVYNAAGVGEDPVYKTIIAVRDGEDTKVVDAAFTNTYSASSLDDDDPTGKLFVTKLLTGKGANVNDTFTLTLTITGTDAVPVWNDGARVTNNGNGTYTITIEHGETVTFANLPDGAGYSVTEVTTGDDDGDDALAKGYTPSYVGCSGTIDYEIAEGHTATVTNDKGWIDGNDVDTGVFTDNMPYFMLLAFVMILAAAVVLKKRTVNE